MYYKYLIILLCLLIYIALPVAALDPNADQSHASRLNKTSRDTNLTITTKPTPPVKTVAPISKPTTIRITPTPTPVPTQIKLTETPPRRSKINPATQPQTKTSNELLIQYPNFNTTLSPILTNIPKSTIYYIITGLLFAIFIVGMVSLIKKNRKYFKRRKKPKKILELTTNIDELYEEEPEEVKEVEAEPEPEQIQEPEEKPKRKKKLKSLLDQDFEF